MWRPSEGKPYWHLVDEIQREQFYVTDIITSIRIQLGPLLIVYQYMGGL